jgi:hypothetical protein
MRRSVLAAVLLLAAPACGTGADSPADPPSGGEGDVPITSAAIAAVAVDHLPEGPSSMEATYTDNRSARGYLGADFRYGADGESDGDLVRVTLQPHQQREVCGNEYDDGCVELDAPDGSRMFLVWQELEPEEDPGIVYVVLQRHEEDVTVYAGGESIDGDPRELDLRLSVTAMTDLAVDDRLHLMTTQAVVDAGEDLEGWGGGETDPHAYDRVPSTDTAVAGAYIEFHGGYLNFRDVRPSPLKADFGDGAIGGRFERDDGRRASTVDVLASPQPPRWMARVVCRTPRFAGHCVTLPGGRTGPRYLAWVPGEQGEIWEVGVRDDEVVAVRYSGLTVPEREMAVVVLGEWYFDQLLLEHSSTFGLTTSRQLLDFDLDELQDQGRGIGAESLGTTGWTSSPTPRSPT